MKNYEICNLKKEKKNTFNWEKIFQSSIDWRQFKINGHNLVTTVHFIEKRTKAKNIENSWFKELHFIYELSKVCLQQVHLYTDGNLDSQQSVGQSHLLWGVFRKRGGWKKKVNGDLRREVTDEDSTSFSPVLRQGDQTTHLLKNRKQTQSIPNHLLTSSCQYTTK